MLYRKCYFWMHLKLTYVVNLRVFVLERYRPVLATLKRLKPGFFSILIIFLIVIVRNFQKLTHQGKLFFFLLLSKKWTRNCISLSCATRILKDMIRLKSCFLLTNWLTLPIFFPPLISRRHLWCWIGISQNKALLKDLKKCSSYIRQILSPWVLPLPIVRISTFKNIKWFSLLISNQTVLSADTGVSEYSIWEFRKISNNFENGTSPAPKNFSKNQINWQVLFSKNIFYVQWLKFKLWEVINM